MKKGLNDCIIVGFALFAMFFGAGNLIFPPLLGFMTGDKWFITFIAFSITGICIPILGIFAVGKAGGEVVTIPKEYLGVDSKGYADRSGSGTDGSDVVTGRSCAVIQG